MRIVTLLRARDAADPDDVRETLDWTRAVKGLPPRKEPIKLRIDSDVIGWFRATDKGYQTRMNIEKNRAWVYSVLDSALV